jgi:hypothetical protein
MIAQTTTQTTESDVTDGSKGPWDRHRRPRFLSRLQKMQTAPGQWRRRLPDALMHLQRQLHCEGWTRHRLMTVPENKPLPHADGIEPVCRCCSLVASTSSLALRATAFGCFGLDLAAPNEQLATIASIACAIQRTASRTAPGQSPSIS